ncbi:MAG: hypothetical protein RLZZ292_1209 [Bacteroidota bacterium]|jgi:hypothetical protein
MKIIKINSQSPEFEAFMLFPKTIYAADSVRQQQSENVNFVAFHLGLTVVENNEIQGRLVVYHNPDLHYKGKKVITIGNYECVDNQAVAKQLLDEATDIAQSLGAEIILGPMNGSTWDSYRFSTSHDEANFFLEPYHHLYYNEHFFNNGFSLFARYFSSKDTALSYDAPTVLEREKHFLAEGVRFRSIDLANFEAELERLYAFNSAAFQTNHLYTPIEKSVFIEKYAATKRIINPDFVRLAEDSEGNLLGYFFCVQDLYNTTEKSLILKTIARHPDKKWAGMGHVIGNQIYRKAAEQGFQSIIHAFMFDEGYSTTISKNFSGERFKNYHLYGKEC